MTYMASTANSHTNTGIITQSDAKASMSTRFLWHTSNKKNTFYALEAN
jgi:hypothetical protein